MTIRNKDVERTCRFIWDLALDSVSHLKAEPGSDYWERRMRPVDRVILIACIAIATAVVLGWL